MSVAVWAVAAFFSGALPFSVWLGQVALGRDVREYGDHNPGAANVYRAGGKALGAVAVLLDFLKGAIPVGLATYVADLNGLALVVVALAPVLGHAFSPFLRFQGGKALAVTFGIWTGLTLWLAPTALGLAMALWLSLVNVAGWAVILAMLFLLVVLLATGAESALLATWLGNALILAWKHRQDLSQPLGLRRSQKR